MNERFNIHFNNEVYSFDKSKVEFIDGYAVLVKILKNSKQK